MKRAQDAAQPTRRPGLRIVPTDARNLLTDANGHAVVALNETALAVWDLCDGTTTTEEIVAAIVELFSLEEADVRRQLVETLSHLRTVGAIDYAP